MVRCQICSGEYEPIQADGTEYYHRCAPLPALELRLADGTRARQFGRHIIDTQVDPLTKKTTVVETFDPPLPPGAVFLRDIVLDRPDVVDENVFPTGEYKGQPKKPGPPPLAIKATL